MKCFALPWWVLLTITFLVSPLDVLAGMQLDLETELRLLEIGKVRQHIPGAKYRVAVFAYEDPNQTSLGTPLAALLANHVLLSSRVNSLGVLHYKGQLAPKNQKDLSYFNKVDRLIESQEVSLAIWGIVQSIGKNLVIDTYLQIPAKTNEEQLFWQFLLPQKMGGGALVAHLHPNRIHVQRHVVPLEARETLVEAAQHVSELREQPTLSAPILGVLPQDEIYWVTQRQGDWVRFKTKAGKSGWVPISGHCQGACTALLDAARFSGEVLAYLSNKLYPPKSRKGLTVETVALGDQIRALDALKRAKSIDGPQWTLSFLRKWLDSSPAIGGDTGTGSNKEKRIPPGGAAFANIRAIAKVIAVFHREFSEWIDNDPTLRRGLRRHNISIGEVFDGLNISPKVVSDVAFELAESSISDPQNLDVLNNLSVLFELAGEASRARLATELAQKVQASLQ